MIITFISILFFIKNKINNYLPISIGIYSLLIFTPIEILSIFKLLDTKIFLFYWLFLTTFSIINIVINRKIYFSSINIHFNSYIFLLFFMLIILFFIALLIIPYDWDSMAYHLPRIEHWVRNKTINHFITYYDNQITRPIMHEFLLLHIRLITGKDYFYNIVEFFTLIIIIFLLNDILNKFNIKNFIKYFSFLLVITIPVISAEATTTEVDLFSAMYFFAFIDIIIDFYKKNVFYLTKNNIILMFFCGLLIGFGYLTKYTIIICSLPFIIVFGIYSISKKISFKNFILYFLIAVIPFIILLTPLSIRHFTVFKNIFGNVHKSQIAIGTYNPKYIFINILKNYSGLCVMPIINNIFVKFVTFISIILNINVDDSLISYSPHFDAMHFTFNVAGASSFIPALLFPINTITLFFLIKLKKIKIIINYKILFLISSFLSILFLLASVRFSFYNNRIFIPSSILMCIIIAILFSFFTKYINIYLLKSIASIISIGTICVYCIFCIINIKHVSFYLDKERIFGYFDDRKFSYKPYKKINDIIKSKNYKKIGLLGNQDMHEYQLWKMIDNKNGIYNIIKTNNNKYLVENNEIVDCIIIINHHYDFIKNKIKIDYNHSIYETKNNDFIQEFY